MSDKLGNEYINTIDYKDMEGKLKDLNSSMEDARAMLNVERKLRYSDINIEAERSSGKLQPDELLVCQHIIDSNIRREQSSYIQYVVQSPRAVILEDVDNPAADTAILEHDLTPKLRYTGWQLQMFPNIDGMQQSGFGIMEIVQDQSKAGELAHEFVQKCDFGVVADTKDLQEAELIGRNYYFSKTTILTKLCVPEELGGKGFSLEQAKKLTDAPPQPTDANTSSSDSRDKSLYCLKKVMFRVNGTVMVAWCHPEKCDGWLRDPRPLFIGRRKMAVNPMTNQPVVNPMTGVPVTQDEYETNYPYYLFSYIISENDTITQLKGRVYLDQDTQEGVTSLLSSFVTAHRRAAGLYFSKDVDDPNSDVLLQKNIYFQTGILINSKVKQFQLQAPGSDMLAGIQSLVTSNQAQTSQINFAAMNRPDSRKTATEVNAAQQESQSLSTVQVVLFSHALRALYSGMFDIIKSRILAGLIPVSPQVAALYQRRYNIKPSGDVDVIERQKLVAQMMQAWPVMQNTPANVAFLSDLLTKMFPDNAPKYLQIFQQAQQQQNMMQQVMQGLQVLAASPQLFSPEGQQKALPAIQAVVQQATQQNNATQTATTQPRAN